jgi:hypothetical protein
MPLSEVQAMFFIVAICRKGYVTYRSTKNSDTPALLFGDSDRSTSSLPPRFSLFISSLVGYAPVCLDRPGERGAYSLPLAQRQPGDNLGCPALASRCLGVVVTLVLHARFFSILSSPFLVFPFFVGNECLFVQVAHEHVVTSWAQVVFRWCLHGPFERE